MRAKSEQGSYPPDDEENACAWQQKEGGSGTFSSHILNQILKNVQIEPFCETHERSQEEYSQFLTSLCDIKLRVESKTVNFSFFLPTIAKPA